MIDLPPWPNYSTEEAEIVSRVLLSNKVNYWTGQEARLFEEEFASHFGSNHAIALANGTLALDLALFALDIGVGDEVIVTPRSFIASASAVVNSGARAIFADVDRESQNITADTIAAVITENTKAIICVHLAGWPCDMNAIRKLADQHSIRLIEDCAQAHGARLNNASVGTFGDISAWSFCQDKIMTTGGEGGMVTTNDEALYHKMWSFKDHGKSFDKVRQPSTSTAFKWIHDSIGTNWRLTEMQAAIGRYQLGKVDDWVAQRRSNADAFLAVLQDVAGLRVPVPDDSVFHACYKYYFFVEPETLRQDWNRDRIVREIHSRGIPCFTGTCPEIYREQAFTDLYGPQPRLPVASELGETSVMMIIHPGITAQQCTESAAIVKDVLSQAIAD